MCTVRRRRHGASSRASSCQVISLHRRQLQPVQPANVQPLVNRLSRPRPSSRCTSIPDCPATLIQPPGTRPRRASPLLVQTRCARSPGESPATPRAPPQEEHKSERGHPLGHCRSQFGRQAVDLPCHPRSDGGAIAPRESTSSAWWISALSRSCTRAPSFSAANAAEHRAGICISPSRRAVRVRDQAAVTASTRISSPRASARRSSAIARCSRVSRARSSTRSGPSSERPRRPAACSRKLSQYACSQVLTLAPDLSTPEWSNADTACCVMPTRSPNSA
jgi:hypothetical protein